MNTDNILVDLKMKMAMNKELIFYTSVLYGLELEIGETPFKTAHTDGTKIVFDEDFLLNMAPEEREGLLLHEVRHVTDMHQFRLAGRDPKLWNTACDHTINLDITADGFKLPNLEHACCDERFKGMAPEEIYEILVDESPEDEPMMQDLPSGGDEGGDDDAQGQGQGQGAYEDAENDVKDLLIQAVQMADRSGDSKAAGNVPAHVRRMVEAWLNPVVPWDVLLQKYMNQKCKDDYSWQRPNRRYLSQGLYTPSLYSEQLGAIHVFIDGSCSVSDKMFSMQVGQIKWVKHNLNPKEIRIIVFNTKIVDEFIFMENEPINVEFKARGGTAVRDVVKYMEKNTCEVNLIMTDGYFHQESLRDVPNDILCLIYDNDNFSWEGSETIYLPKEK